MESWDRKLRVQASGGCRSRSHSEGAERRRELVKRHATLLLEKPTRYHHYPDRNPGLMDPSCRSQGPPPRSGGLSALPG